MMPRTVIVHYLHTNSGEITVKDSHAELETIRYESRRDRIKKVAHIMYDLKRSGGSNLSEIAVHSRDYGCEHGVSIETFRVYASG